MPDTRRKTSLLGRRHQNRRSRASRSSCRGSFACVDFGLDTSYGRSTWFVPGRRAARGHDPRGGDARELDVSHARARAVLRRQLHSRRPRLHDGPCRLDPASSRRHRRGGNPQPGVELVNVIDPIGISVVTDLSGTSSGTTTTRRTRAGRYAFPIKPLPNGNTSRDHEPLHVGFPVPNSVLREIDLAAARRRPKRPEGALPRRPERRAREDPDAQGTYVTALTYSHDVTPLRTGTRSSSFSSRRAAGDDASRTGEFLVLATRWWSWTRTTRRCGSGPRSTTRREPAPMSFDEADGYDWTHCNCVLLAPDGTSSSPRGTELGDEAPLGGRHGDGAILGGSLPGDSR